MTACCPSFSNITTRMLSNSISLLAMSVYSGRTYPSESIIPWTKPRMTSRGKRNSSDGSLSYLRCARYRANEIWPIFTRKRFEVYPSGIPGSVEALNVRVNELTFAVRPVRTCHCETKRSAKAWEVTCRIIRSGCLIWVAMAPFLQMCFEWIVAPLTHPSPKTTPITYPKAYCFLGSKPKASISAMICSIGGRSRRFLRLGCPMRFTNSHCLHFSSRTSFGLPHTGHGLWMQAGQYFCRLLRGVNGLSQSKHRDRISIDEPPTRFVSGRAMLATSSTPTILLPQYITIPPVKPSQEVL